MMMLYVYYGCVVQFLLVIIIFIIMYMMIEMIDYWGIEMIEVKKKDDFEKSKCYISLRNNHSGEKKGSVDVCVVEVWRS